MKKLFMLFCIGVFSNATYGQFDFSSPSASSWTVVDLIYPGATAPSSARIEINSVTERLEFTNAADDNNDIRIYRAVNPMCDNWTAEFDFEVTSSSTGNVFYIPFVLTENNENAIGERLNGISSYTTTDNNAIGTYVRKDGVGQNMYIGPFCKLGTQNWASSDPGERVNLTFGDTYHVTLERLSLSQGKMTVEGDNDFYEVRCFDIDTAINDLTYLQVSNNPAGGWSKSITGWVDNIDVFNCIKKKSCCIDTEIMGLSDLCMPNSNISFYSVNSNADNYDWSVSNGATIVSGEGTNTIGVDFSSATGPITISVTIECNCVETTLSKTTNCPSSSSLIQNTNDENGTIENHQISLDNELIQGEIIEIYPNPSNGTFLLEGVDVLRDYYSITTVDGKTITAKQALRTNSIDLSDQKDGVYILIVNHGEEKSILKLMKSSH